MTKSLLLLGATIVAAAATSAACGGPGPSNPTNPTASAPSTTASTVAPPPEDAGVITPPDAAPPPAQDAAPPPPSAFAAQAQTGNTLYQKLCAECHDSDGTGISAPPVVGLAKGALPANPPSDAKERKTKFNTWFDVGDFVVKAMPPPDKKVKLKDDETWAIMAWILQKNGGDTGGAALDANLAKTLPIRH